MDLQRFALPVIIALVFVPAAFTAANIAVEGLAVRDVPDIAIVAFGVVVAIVAIGTRNGHQHFALKGRQARVFAAAIVIIACVGAALGFCVYALSSGALAYGIGLGFAAIVGAAIVIAIYPRYEPGGRGPDRGA